MPVPRRCCRFPNYHRHSNASAPATASAHSGWPLSYPTCGRVSAAKPRTIRAATRSRVAIVLYELVAVRPVVVHESLSQRHIKLRFVPAPRQQWASHALAASRRTCAGRAPSTRLPECPHPLYRAGSIRHRHLPAALPETCADVVRDVRPCDPASTQTILPALPCHPPVDRRAHRSISAPSSSCRFRVPTPAPACRRRAPCPPPSRIDAALLQVDPVTDCCLPPNPPASIVPVPLRHAHRSETADKAEDGRSTC